MLSASSYPGTSHYGASARPSFSGITSRVCRASSWAQDTKALWSSCIDLWRRRPENASTKSVNNPCVLTQLLTKAGGITLLDSLHSVTSSWMFTKKSAYNRFRPDKPNAAETQPKTRSCHSPHSIWEQPCLAKDYLPAHSPSCSLVPARLPLTWSQQSRC